MPTAHINSYVVLSNEFNVFVHLMVVQKKYWPKRCLNICLEPFGQNWPYPQVDMVSMKAAVPDHLVILVDI